MIYQKALHGILFSIIVTTSIFMGLSIFSQQNPAQGVFGDPYLETRPVSSDAASVPTWDMINHTKLVIDTQEAPPPSATIPAGVSGVSVPIATINRTWNKALSVNATNSQPQMNLTYTDRYTILCTSVPGGSNFTINLNTPLIRAYYGGVNFTNLKSNWQSIKIRCPTNQTSFTPKNITTNSPLYPLIWPNVTVLDNRTSRVHFDFNISQAVEVFESRSLYTGASYLFELNYTITVNCSSWVMATKTGENFRIEGSQSTRFSNYTLSFRVSGPKGVNITFHYIPIDRNYTSKYSFYVNSINLTSPVPTYDLALKGWRITAPGGGLVKLNSTGIAFRIEFRGNATIGFVEQMAGRWNSDGMASSLDSRTRKYKLEVLSGPSTLILERVEFTANDIAFSTLSQISRFVTPTSSIAVSDDTYKYYDPLQEQEVTKSNGTKLVIGRIQKANGPVTVSFNYEASYNASLRILDELRNPLPGAEVTLYFHGIRFGTLMSVNASNLQPSKLANSLGTVTFNYLPEGNYSVEVRFQTWVKTQEFTLSGGAKSVSIDVVTGVPYQPWILVAWIAVFGMLCALGIVLFKRKK